MFNRISELLKSANKYMKQHSDLSEAIKQQNLERTVELLLEKEQQGFIKSAIFDQWIGLAQDNYSVKNYLKIRKSRMEHFAVDVTTNSVPDVVHQNRYNPTVQKVRKWFEEGKLGKLYLIQANVFWQRPQSYYDAETWRGKRHLDGGAFMNQASHYVDLVQWFGGEIDSVKSEVATLGRNIECEDTGAAIIRFKSNTIGILAVSMLTYPENQEGSLTFLAENATIKIGGKALNKLEVCKAKDEAIFADTEQTNYEPATVYGNGHGEYYRNLCQYIKEPNHPEAIHGREGLKSLKLLTDIYREQDQLR